MLYKWHGCRGLRCAVCVAVLAGSALRARAQQPGEPYRVEPVADVGQGVAGIYGPIAQLPPMSQQVTSQLPANVNPASQSPYTVWQSPQPVVVQAPVGQYPKLAALPSSFAPVVAPTPPPAIAPSPASQYGQNADPTLADDSDPRRVPAKLASYPRDVTEPLLDQPNNFVLIPEAAQPQMPPTRAGFFQRIAATTTYLPRFDDFSVGFEDTEVYGVFALPCPTRDCPLLIEPGTDFWVVDSAPQNFDLPPTLHDDYLEFHWLGKLSDTWGADLMITPGWHSDYHNDNGSQAFRLESHAVAAYTWSPTLKIAAGVAYWGRLSTTFVPAGGIIWTPNPYTRFELITPKPRIMYRVNCDPCYEQWAYIAGEFGGGQWAIQQEGGVDNIVDYTDYRIMAGLEHKSLNLGLNGFAEVGYVFGRQLQYQHFLPDQNMPGTMVARLGVSY